MELERERRLHPIAQRLLLPVHQSAMAQMRREVLLTFRRSRQRGGILSCRVDKCWQGCGRVPERLYPVECRRSLPSVGLRHDRGYRCQGCPTAVAHRSTENLKVRGGVVVQTDRHASIVLVRLPAPIDPSRRVRAPLRRTDRRATNRRPQPREC